MACVNTAVVMYTAFLCTKRVCSAQLLCVAGPNGQITKCVPTTGSCPAGQIPLIGTDGQVQSCQNGGICPTSFPVTVRADAAGNIKQCQAVGLGCPVGYSTPLYGIFTYSGAPTGLTITNCWLDGVITTTCNVNVAAGSIQAGGEGFYGIPYMSAVGATTVVGCVKTGSTSCPSNTGLTYISMTTGTAASLERCYQTAATSCEAPSTSSPTFSTPAYTLSALTACIRGLATSNSCPLSGAGTYPVTATTVGNPLTSPPNGTQILACYSSASTCFANAQPYTFTLISNSSPAKTYCVAPITGVSTCAQYGAAASGDPAVGATSRALTANGGQWVGCTQSGASACPVPYVQQVTDGSGVVSCSLGTPNTCTSDQYQVWEVVNGVPQPTSCVAKSPDGCVAKFGAGGFALMKTGAAADGGAQIGCLGLVAGGANQACPSGYFSVYVAPVSGKAPILSQCWPNSGFTTSCAGFNPSTVRLGSTVSSVLAGCTVTTASCPATFPYFYASDTGSLPSPIAGDNSCVSSTISSCGNRVPVIDGTNGGALGPIVGCLGSNAQLAAGQACPAVPTPSTVTSTFTFWTAQAQDSGSFVAGRISACYRKDAANACGTSQIAARVYNSTAVVGCFQNPGATCPVQAVAGSIYSTALLSANGAQALACSTAPGGFDCVGVAGGFSVPVTNGDLSGSVPASALLGCVFAPATACPSSSYPVISAAGAITSCRTSRSACMAADIPICELAGVMPADGRCNGTYTFGCIGAGAPRSVCGAYSHPIFAVQLNGGLPGSFKALVGCFSTITSCTGAGAGGLYPNAAVTGTTFNGCTDQSQQGCQTWWSNLGGTTCTATP